MKAVILAGGYGKRLRPLTDTVPKPLVDVAGRPILEWQMLWLSKKCGVESFVLLVGYLKERVMEYIDSKKDEFGVEVKYSVEKEPMGTGGALKNAEKLLAKEKQFYMLNGDNVTNIRADKMASLGGNIASVALVPLRSTYGIARLDGDKIATFDEKPILPEYWMNAGVYLMSKEIFKSLPKVGSIENTTFVELSKAGKLMGQRFPDAYFKGVDSVKDVEEASTDIKTKRVYGALQDG